MVNSLVIALFLTIFSIEYLVRERGLLHPYLVLTPELLSGIAMVVVLARIMAGVRVNLDWRYALFLGLLGLTMLFGFVLQDVPTGAVLAGIRAHLKFVPFFLLPVVYPFTPAALKTQLITLMACFAVQTPLAVYQRFVEYANMMDTGDPVRGTATTSSALSMLMICAIAAVSALYFRRKISLALAVGLIGLFFLPTTLNETKATLLLLPFALLIPPLSMRAGGGARRRIWPIAAVGALAAFAFVGTYDHFIQYRPGGQSIGQFLAEANFRTYLYSGAANQEANYIGRFDSIEIAAERISRDPLTLAFGLGAGNVSTSFLARFDGEHADYYDRFGVGMTQITQLLWEIGVVGLLTYLMFYGLVLRDAASLARGSGPVAALGQIWVAVTVVMSFGLIYKSIFSMNEIGYLFWYFSGVVVAFAASQRKEQRSRALGRAPGRPLGAQVDASRPARSTAL
jgi:hypothetical protein